MRTVSSNGPEAPLKLRPRFHSSPRSPGRELAKTASPIPLNTPFEQGFYYPPLPTTRKPSRQTPGCAGPPPPPPPPPADLAPGRAGPAPARSRRGEILRSMNRRAVRNQAAVFCAFRPLLCTTFREKRLGGCSKNISRPLEAGHDRRSVRGEIREAEADKKERSTRRSGRFALAGEGRRRIVGWRRKPGGRAYSRCGADRPGGEAGRRRERPSRCRRPGSNDAAAAITGRGPDGGRGARAVRTGRLRSFGLPHPSARYRPGRVRPAGGRRLRPAPAGDGFARR